jgi:hypothetical protein
MTTGENSSFPLTRLAAKYNQIQNDGQILSNRAVREIIWQRILQLSNDIDTKDTPGKIKRLRDLWNDMREKEERGQTVEARVVALKIDDEFEKIDYLFQAWDQMFEACSLHAKMTESEVKIMKDMRALMSAEDAYELVAKVMAVMLEVLKDEPKRLKEAQFALTRLIGETGGRFRNSGGTSRIIDGPGIMDREGVFDTGDEERSETSWADETGQVSEGRNSGDIQSG